MRFHATGESFCRHRVFFVAAAAVMLHIADDNFLQPEEGMAPVDHLASGLIPLTLLAVGARVYPRARFGAQALIALAVGLTGLVVGLVEAGYYTLRVGPSGDDYTGYLAGLSGLVLVGLGVRTLWRSRRPGPTRTRRYVRRAAIGVLAAATLSELVVPFAFAYLTTHVAGAEVPEAHLGAPYEDITLTTTDGLRLEGWYVPSTNRAAVILFAGRTNSQPHARMLVRHGYGVLLMDRRGEGASEGESNMYGWRGERDILAAVSYLKGRPDVDPKRIGGIGFSVGGELMLQAAAESTDLAAVVSEGAGTRTLSEQLEEYSARSLLREFPALLATNVGVQLFSNQAPPPSLVDLVPHIAPRPTLLIWAPNGGNLETMNPLYKELIGSSASIWSVPDARHIKAFEAHPEEYERRVVGFLDDALLDVPTGVGEGG